jgi:Double zinc ribbon
MIYCPKCHTSLAENAKFCHQCGANVDIPLSDCPHCDKKNPADTQFCFGCGKPMSEIILTPQLTTTLSRYDFEIPMKLEEQIKNQFFEALKTYANWISPAKTNDYLLAVVTQNFTKTLELRAKQIADELSAHYNGAVNPSVIYLEKSLENAVCSLALYHIIYNCKEINPFPISEKIVRYEKAVRGQFDLKNMIFDYSNFETEKEKVYTDFIKMPANTLHNAAKNYLFAAKGEFIYFISDRSFLGNGKEGFAMTEFALYWKTTMEKPQKVYYHHLARLERERDWIKINNRFFNINPALNAKIILLLDKIKRIYV